MWAAVCSLRPMLNVTDEASQSRQSLCETVPYYHAYQQSLYMHDGFAYGILLDEDRGDGAYCDKEVIVSRL